MQVSVEAPNNLQRRITVVVPVDKIDQAIDKKVVDLSKTADINGFRKGKIPLDYIKKRYGDSVRQQALSEVIQTSLREAINKEKLNPVDVPVVEPKEVVPGQPLEFVATFEVMPEVEAVKFSLDSIEKQTATVENEDVDKVVNHLQQQQVTWASVERPAKDTDQVVIDFCGKIDGKEFDGGKASDYAIVIGSKTMIPGFEEGLVGIKAGEEKNIPVKFPESYFAKEFAGKEAEFSVKAIKVSKANLPEINEDFIKKFGVKTGKVDDFKVEVRNNLERELSRMVESKLKKEVFDNLLLQNPIEMPKAVVEREAKRIHEQLHPHHAGGKDHGHSKEEMASFDEAAKRNVALGMLVAKLIQKHSISPDKSKIEAQIKKMSGVYEDPAEIVSYYENNKQAKAEIEMQVIEDQLVEKLLENVTVKENKVGYSELINSLNQQTNL